MLVWTYLALFHHASAPQMFSQTGVNSTHLSNAALQGKALAEKLPDALAHVVIHDSTGRKMGYLH